MNSMPELKDLLPKKDSGIKTVLLGLYINVAPKREQGGRKKLGTKAQQKTHAG
jgi:hypothetical protein